MKTSISKSEYNQLIGLLALAAGFNSKLKDIEEAVNEIIEENDECGGHSFDAIYCNYPAKELLKKLNIKVV